MSSYISAGGPMVWPAILLGTLGLVAAALYAFRQGTRAAAVARAATAGSLLCALVNTLLGAQHSMAWQSRAGEPDLTLLLKWVGESLNGLVVALVIALLVSLLFVIAAFRSRDVADAT